LSARRSVCFIDTNIIANWVLAEGGVLSLLVDKYELDREFEEIYRKRYSDSVDLVELILENALNGHKEFLISNLSLQELFSAIRDELRSIVLFKKGYPISRWKDPRINPDFNEEEYHDVYKKVLESFDILFQGSSIQPIRDIQSFDEKEYWDVFSSILFLVKESQTQDVILLTTSIFNKADYFVTKDERLIKSTKKILKENYNLQITSPKNARRIFSREIRHHINTEP